MLARYGIPIGHIGQISQIPKRRSIGRVAQHPDVITVYSPAEGWMGFRRGREIGRLQHVLVRVWDEGDIFFDGQEGGFRAEESSSMAVLAIDALPESGGGQRHLVFPSMEYSFDAARFPVQPLPNFATVRTAVEAHRPRRAGLELPGAQCARQHLGRHHADHERCRLHRVERAGTVSAAPRFHR
ncbi:MAG: hypothetical protein M9947_08095 [Thermomicrobiales bacterium]|nr:hypothetical protein [Thermomicrobiales bacterium]